MGKSKKEKKAKKRKKQKKQKDLQSGHLVEKTIGSSNEISFDVLQKKKLEAVSTKESDPWVIPAENVAKRKRDRFRSHLIIALVAITVILAITAISILGVAAWMQQQSGSYAQLQSEIGEVYKNSLALDDSLNATQDLLTKDGDEISKTITSGNLEKFEKITSAKKSSLESDKDKITETMKDIGTPLEREIGNNTLLLVDKELQLVASQEEVFEYAIPYVAIRNESAKAFAKMTEADTADEQATTYLLKGTTDDANKAIQAATESKQAVNDAKTEFETAQNRAEKVKKVFSDVNTELETYIQFCELYASAQDATIAAANAYVMRNSDELTKQNDLYNSLKKQTSAIAKKWDTKITDKIDEAYKTKREGSVEAFKENIKERNSLFERVQKYVDDNNLG